MAISSMLGVAALSAGVKAYQDHKAGQAGQRADVAAADISESQAQVADFNAKVATAQATDAIARGAEEEGRYRLQIKSTIGAQRVGFAGGNVDVGFGSAVDVQADTAHTGELDALKIRSNAVRTAWGYSVQAADYSSQAAIDRKAAANQVAAGSEAATTGNLAAGGDLLTGSYSLLNTQ